MKILPSISLILALSSLLPAAAEPNKNPQPATEAALSEEDLTALEIGRAVMAVDRALAFKVRDAPTPEQKAEADKHMETMVGAGGSTQLYPWVRSRIDLEIRAAQSLLRDINQDEARTRELTAQIKYLIRVRYLIDAPR